jgi:hypothetical protein
MRGLGTEGLLVWSGATLGLLFLFVHQALGRRPLKTSFSLAGFAMLGGLSALALSVLALLSGAYHNAFRIDLDAESFTHTLFSLVGQSHSLLAIFLAPTACVATLRALREVPVVRSRGRSALVFLLDLLSMVGPVTALVVAWIAFGPGMHATVQLNDDAGRDLWHFWFEAWEPLVFGLPASTAVALGITLFHALVLDRSDRRSAFARGGWLLGLHGAAWFIVMMNFPDA